MSKEQTKGESQPAPEPPPPPPNETTTKGAPPPSAADGNATPSPADLAADNLALIEEVEKLRAAEAMQQQQIQDLIAENRRLSHGVAALEEELEALPATARMTKKPTAVVKLEADMALGAGDRKAGTTLCAVHCAKGVSIDEVINAFRNPTRINVG